MGLRRFSKSLTANERWPIAAAGDFVRCTEGASTFDLTLIKPDSGSPNETDFDRLEIVNGSTAQTVTIYVGVPDRGRGGQETIEFQNGFGYADSELTDSRLTGLINITGGISTKVSPASTIAYSAPTVTASAASLVASSTDGRNVLIQPQDGDIYIGSDASITTANAFKVPNGATFSYTSGDELFAIGGASVDVRLLTETYT